MFSFLFFFWGGGVRSGVGVGRGGSKLWGRWVMWGMGDVNQEKKALLNVNQRTNGPVNAHLISWPSKAQNIQNLKNIW